EELRIVGRVEGEAPVRLERGVRLADRVEARHQRDEALRATEIPALDLVLLGIEVFLALARIARPVLAELEGGTVHAVVRGERGGEHGTDAEGRERRPLQVIRKDGGRVR